MGNSEHYTQMDGKEQQTHVLHVPPLLTQVLPCPNELHLQNTSSKTKNFKMVKALSVRPFWVRGLVQWHELQADTENMFIFLTHMYIVEKLGHPKTL